MLGSLLYAATNVFTICNCVIWFYPMDILVLGCTHFMEFDRFWACSISSVHLDLTFQFVMCNMDSYPTFCKWFISSESVVFNCCQFGNTCSKCNVFWYECVTCIGLGMWTLLPGCFTVKILKFWSRKNSYIYSHSVLMYLWCWQRKSEAVTRSGLLNVQLVANTKSWCKWTVTLDARALIQIL
jgi:hypothetical protein